MNLNSLLKINSNNIDAAGPRYSPSLDPNSPNLEINSLLSAIEALGLTDKFYKNLIKKTEDLAKEWSISVIKLKGLFKKENPGQLIRYLGILQKQKAWKTDLTVRSIKILSKESSLVLQKERERLQIEKEGTKEHSNERKIIEQHQSKVRRLMSSIHGVDTLMRSQEYKFLKANRMLLLGEWGTGKTHFLCDITKQRQNRNLPTLFFLAYRLPDNTNPLEAICKETGLAPNASSLLKQLNALGKRSNSRALIIFDGINEGDRNSWKKHLSSIALLVKQYPYVAIIVSCRMPFDRQIFSSVTRKAFIPVIHPGFQENEFNAQREFFRYYNVPTPNVPLLTPEFSRPLFLKILCLTFSGKTSTVKSRWINEIASGQKGMTKLFEDFVVYIGSKIEKDFRLPFKSCWKILKGDTVNGKLIGIAVSMAKQVQDYLSLDECLNIIENITSKNGTVIKNILSRMVTEGLLIEDSIWSNNTHQYVIRLPYQRFSDHMIARHLLKNYLNTKSEQSIRKSFYKHRPLGKIFDLQNGDLEYAMPGLASAIMLEFPERVKNKLPEGERELVFYLPKRRQLIAPLIDTFLEGVLWRNKDSFSNQTDIIFSAILENCYEYQQQRALDALVCLACRPNHPYSAKRLYSLLSKKSITQRDLLWSEFLRNAYPDSVIYRILNWLEDSHNHTIDQSVAENTIILLSLFLTSTNKNLRDKSTRFIVAIGENHPEILFKKTINSLEFNDPYVPERMLAACYGILMRGWAFASKELKRSASTFACILYDKMFASKAPHTTTHILVRDYALGILELARLMNKNCLGKRALRRLKSPFLKPKLHIPNADKLSDKYCKMADSAIHMDFGNYTIGRLVPGRRNYDAKNPEYRKVLKQIKWRILDLGYSKELFDDIDGRISSNNFYYQQRENAGHVDRYGKKYSWIAYFEVAGMRATKGVFGKRYSFRISECDIDPSFPDDVKLWEPKLLPLFTKQFTTAREWIKAGTSPSYDHLLEIDEVDNLKGPWILLDGYINEASLNDDRKIFSFVNTNLVNASDIRKLRNKFNNKKYPGNHAIPGGGTDNYTFAGEIPWSKKFAGGHYKNRKRIRHLEECFEEQKTLYIKKQVSQLTESEKFSVGLKSINIAFSNNEMQSLRKKRVLKPSSYVKVPTYVNIPGILVEVPIHSFGWESYHSNENQTGNVDYPAPAICEFLNLRKKGSSHDLYDSKGNQATIYRKFGDDTEYFMSNLFFIRKDLLVSYLRHNKQKLVWFIWGERDFKHEVFDIMRSQAADLWTSYRHIHKKIKVARL